MKTLVWTLCVLFGICFWNLTSFTVQADAATKTEETAETAENKSSDDDAEEDEDEAEEEDEVSGEQKDESKDEGPAEPKLEGEEDGEEEFICNLKYKTIGCYANVEDKVHTEKPLKSFLMSDKELQGITDVRSFEPSVEKFNKELPKFACMCANEALTSGNAIFGLTNYSDCWSGPDDSKYDSEGPSNDCITFDFKDCEPNHEICAGKETALFMYYIDTPGHNKTPEEENKELQEENKELQEGKQKELHKEKKKEKRKEKKKKLTTKKSKKKESKAKE